MRTLNNLRGKREDDRRERDPRMCVSYTRIRRIYACTRVYDAYTRLWRSASPGAVHRHSQHAHIPPLCFFLRHAVIRFEMFSLFFYIRLEMFSLTRL